MRLLFYISLVLLVACACTSEQTSQNTPEEAVKGLFGALKNNDFETARLYGTTSTQSSLLDFETNLKMSNPEEKQTLMAPFQINVQSVSCAENLGTTLCKLCCSSEGDTATIEVVQQDNKWFAQLDFAF